MKKVLYLILTGVFFFGIVSCNKDLEPTNDSGNPDGPVILTATIADETTKASVSESDGSFSFSAGDAILVYDGTATYAGITTSGGSSAKFAMEDGFDASGAGIAAFPSALVSSINSATAVVFNLPRSYSYSDVGGTDADAAKVPVLMVATKVAGSTNLSFKQVASLVRFRVTNCQAGVLHFTFSSNVTGTAELTNVVPGTTGITASNLSGTKSMTIAVTGVPAVEDGSYIYITLPVPVGTDPMNVQVVNLGAATVSSATLSGTAAALERAGGRRRGVTLGTPITPQFSISSTQKVTFAPGNLQATYDASAETWTWDFAANQYDYIGNAPGNTTIITEVKESTEPFAKLSASGTVDIFGWSTANTYFGIASSTSHETYTTEAFADWGNLVIGSQTAGYWRTMTNSEWDYLLNTRSCSTIGETENARYLKANTVSGVVQGLIMFPDNFTWNETTMGTIPTSCNSPQAYITQQFTSAQWASLEAAGAIFLPASGYKYQYGLGNIGEKGNYWSSSKRDDNRAFYMFFHYNGRNNSTLSAQEHDYGNFIASSVRLVHDLNQ
ncbi:MAG: hypothetical protein IJQ93_09830 [Bacteroidales bacterium]|nr:hypothetical protein [Bacteroidales bacterium]